MKKIFFFTFFILQSVFYFTSTFAQSTSENSISNTVPFQLKNDTLYSNTGMKIVVGQEIYIGKACGYGEEYRSIISSKAAIVPSIWGQDKRFENAVENYVDSKKNKARLKQFLVTGKPLTIKKIILSKSGKPYFYLVSLYSDSGECKADIQLALSLGELLLRPH